MTKREAEKEFKAYIMPEVKRRYESDGIIDVPARSEAWNNYTDSLCKDGRITSKQYSTWTHPACTSRR